MTEDEIINRIEGLKKSKWRFNNEVDTMLAELKEKRIEIVKAKNAGKISEEEARQIRR